MDFTDTLAPKSDQLDNIELVGGPRIFTISAVGAGPNADQPMNVHFSDFPRPWRPNLGMRRILGELWGTNSGPNGADWIGRKVRLYSDPNVTFGKDNTGGTRISGLSHIDGPKKARVQEKRGRIVTVTIDPLAAGPQIITDEQAQQFLNDIHNAQDQAGLSEIGKQLKAFDLGVYKVELQTAWSNRSAELKQSVQGAIDDGEQEA